MSDPRITKKQGSLEPASEPKRPSFCTHCGTALEGYEKFCPECGQAILKNSAAGKKGPETSVALVSGKPDLKDVYAKADEYQKKKEFKKAIELLLEFLPDNAGNSTLINRIGYAYRQSGDDDKAIEYYKKALEVDLRAVYYNNLAYVYRKKGMVYEALFYFREAMEKLESEEVSNRGFIRVNYAQMIGELGDLHGARENLLQAEKEGEKKEDVELIWLSLLRKQRDR